MRTDLDRALGVLQFLDQLRRAGLDQLSPDARDAYHRAVSMISVDLSGCDGLFALSTEDFGPNQVVRSMSRQARTDYQALSPDGESELSARLGKIFAALQRIEDSA